VPGHWEGHLLIGQHNQTAIGTLVERAIGYTMLLHLPGGYGPEQVRAALTGKIQTLPAVLRRSLTWDQGPEMGLWKQVAIAADIAIYFCDPHAPWQRGSNENTNGLLPVLSQGHRSRSLQRGRTRRRGRRTQRPAPQALRLCQTDRAHR
jgi:IS30 family transposase